MGSPSSVPSWVTFELPIPHPQCCQILTTPHSSSIVGCSMALVYYQCDQPTLCLGWPKIAVCPSNWNHTHSWWLGQPQPPWLVPLIKGLVMFALMLVAAWVGTWLVTTGCPAGAGISIPAISRGLKELTSVSRIVWSESICLTDMIHHIQNVPSQSEDSWSIPYVRGQNTLAIEILYMSTHL